MPNVRVERRLAAIMAADIVAYSRLIEADEARTLTAIRALRSNVIDPLIADHGGRIVKLMGDGAILEFGSVVDAVACAVAMQEGTAVHQREVPPESRIVYRIGINVGDVVVEDGDLLGDGVNIAARLEGLAEPGGICIADSVCKQLGGKTDFAFEDTGERTLKNIAQPVRVWRWTKDPTSPAEVAPLPLPDRPSIAVLPFDNLTGQPEETYFSDGITEDIITGLARFRSLFVIARNSSFAFRGKPVEAAEIGRRLGVSYLLEGSIRRAGERVRITAQLIEATTGSHVWGERYDRSLDDIFAVQDELAQTIVATLFGRIEAAKLQQSLRKPTISLAAYDLMLRGLVHLRGYASDDNEKALRMFEMAAELDPGYAIAHAFSGLAAVLLHRQVNAGTITAEALEQSLDRALTGINLDPQDNRCHRAVQLIRLYRREYGLAEHHARQAIALNPNDANDMAQLGHVLAVRGRHEEALFWFEKAKRLNPFHPPFYHAAQSATFYPLRCYEDAVQAIKLLPGLNASLRARLAACYAQLGDLAEARAHVAALLREQPGVGAAEYVNRDFVYERPEDREHFREGLVKAGLPP
jgi:TolB-like protein/class 3 adenylate cyclase